MPTKLRCEIAVVDSENLVAATTAAKWLTRVQSAFEFEVDEPLSDAVRRASPETDAAGILPAPTGFAAIAEAKADLKGYHPFSILVTKHPVQGRTLSNLFSTAQQEEGKFTGAAIVSSNDVLRFTRGLPIEAFFVHQFLKIAVGWVVGSSMMHEAAPDWCFFHQRKEKWKLAVSLREWRICDACHEKIAGRLDVGQLVSLRQAMSSAYGALAIQEPTVASTAFLRLIDVATNFDVVDTLDAEPLGPSTDHHRIEQSNTREGDAALGRGQHRLRVEVDFPRSRPLTRPTCERVLTDAAFASASIFPGTNTDGALLERREDGFAISLGYQHVAVRVSLRLNGALRAEWIWDSGVEIPTVVLNELTSLLGRIFVFLFRLADGLAFGGSIDLKALVNGLEGGFHAEYLRQHLAEQPTVPAYLFPPDPNRLLSAEQSTATDGGPTNSVICGLTHALQEQLYYTIGTLPGCGHPVSFSQSGVTALLAPLHLFTPPLSPPPDASDAGAVEEGPAPVLPSPSSSSTSSRPAARLAQSENAQVAPLPAALRYALIMNGGGVKGLAFVGALLEMRERLDITFDTFGGTSAGSIAATALAMGYSPDHLRKTFSSIPFTSFLKRSWSPPWNTAPWDLTEAPKRPVLARAFLAVVTLPFAVLRTPLQLAAFVLPFLRGALYTTDTVKRFISYLSQWRPRTDELPLERNVHDHTITLGALAPRRLFVVASGTGPKQKVIFDDNETIDLAVRASMAIPGFFTPVRRGPEILYDGGIIANFAYDEFIARYPDRREQTIGLYLFPEEDGQPQNDDAPSLLALAKHLGKIVLGQDEVNVVRENDARIIKINTSPISTIDFNLSAEDKELLLLSGRLGVVRYLWEKKPSLPFRGPEKVPSKEEYKKLLDEVNLKRAEAAKRWWLPHQWRRLRFILAITGFALLLIALLVGLGVAGTLLFVAPAKTEPAPHTDREGRDTSKIEVRTETQTDDDGKEASQDAKKIDPNAVSSVAEGQPKENVPAKKKPMEKRGQLVVPGAAPNSVDLSTAAETHEIATAVAPLIALLKKRGGSLVIGGCCHIRRGKQYDTECGQRLAAAVIESIIKPELSLDQLESVSTDYDCDKNGSAFIGDFNTVRYQCPERPSNCMSWDAQTCLCSKCVFKDLSKRASELSLACSQMRKGNVVVSLAGKLTLEGEDRDKCTHVDDNESQLGVLAALEASVEEPSGIELKPISFPAWNESVGYEFTRNDTVWRFSTSAEPQDIKLSFLPRIKCDAAGFSQKKTVKDYLLALKGATFVVTN